MPEVRAKEHIQKRLESDNCLNSLDHTRCPCIDSSVLILNETKL